MKLNANGVLIPDTLMKEEVTLTSKVITYAFNYKHNFILEAFAGSTLANHFQSKFSDYYNRFGNGEQAFIHLWMNMTDDHRLTLANYINETFKG